MVSPVGPNAFLCCKNLGKSVEDIHNISPTIIFEHVATRTEPLVNTLVDIVHKLLCIRDDSFGFRLLTLTYATLTTLLTVLRGRYTVNCYFWF
jgi:hypothetical protein